MGRAYETELRELPGTLAWAESFDLAAALEAISELVSAPLIVVGSGGSLSAADLVARLHQWFARQPARVFTPLEFALLPPDNMSGVLLLSGGGSNPDILNAADHAVAAEYPSVVAVIARPSSPLASTLRECRYARCVEFSLPSGRDGFLATNSLIATAVVLSRAYRALFNDETLTVSMPQFQERKRAALTKQSLAVLAGGWGWPAAVDFESKCNEAGFGTVVCTDYRNFAHGRHHGLAKRVDSSGVIAFISPDCESVALKTLALLPRRIPVVRVSTQKSASAGALELLLLQLQVIGQLAAELGVDPGRPKVAPFGRKLYHLNTAALRNGRSSKADRQRRIDSWIRRKVGTSVWIAAPVVVRDEWRANYQAWAMAQRWADFSGLVFDYDGTVCEADERDRHPNGAIGAALVDLMDEGLQIGVATGRGGSVVDALRVVIPRRHWPSVTLGLYNGGLVTTLAEGVPANQTRDAWIFEAEELLASSSIIKSIATVKPSGSGQLTVRSKIPLSSGRLRHMVIEAIASKPAFMVGLSVYESAHSVDIVSTKVSKTIVVDHLSEIVLTLGGTKREVMTIGDQGSLTGNDFALLSRPHAVSVYRVSSALDRCWNLASRGRRGSAAFMEYLLALRIRDKSDAFHFDIDKLELGHGGKNA